MKKIILPLAIVAQLVLVACNNTPAEPKTEVEEVVEAEETSAEMPESTRDSIVSHINTFRTNVEENIGEAKSLKTEGLRENVKQKWSKIDFYTLEGKLVRIKTYPHENISTRTEEFYLENGMLVLSVIEDNGSGDRGKELAQMDKVYYFHNGEPIQEFHGNEEPEFSVKEGDAERLLAEVKEYQTLYAKQ